MVEVEVSDRDLVVLSVRFERYSQRFQGSRTGLPLLGWVVYIVYYDSCLRFSSRNEDEAAEVPTALVE